MKWTENGITFEGTPAEYRELHAECFQQQPIRTRRGKQVIVEENNGNQACFQTIRTRRGKQVIVEENNGNQACFQTIIEAAQWITKKTGRFVSASSLGRMLDKDGHFSLDCFLSNSATLFDNNQQPQGEEENGN